MAGFVGKCSAVQRLLNQRGKRLFNLLTVSFRLFPLYTKIVIYTKKPGWFAIDCKSSGFSI